MPYGFQVRTTNGLVDLTQTLALRQLGTGTFDLPRGSQYQREVDFNIPAEFRSDLGSGPILLCARGVRVPESPGRIYDLSIRIRDDHYYFANASSIPASIRIQINARTNGGLSSDVNSYTNIMLFGIQL